eukprot:140602_1
MSRGLAKKYRQWRNSLLLLLCASIRIPSCIAFHDVASIDISTTDDDGSSSQKTIIITLWFNFTIYQYSLLANNINYTYSTTSFDIVGPSGCHNNIYE